MAKQESNVTDLQRHSAIQDVRISNLETKFEMFMREMSDFKQEMRQQNEMRQVEMRDRDNQRAAEIAEVRNDIKEIYKTTDAKIDSYQQDHYFNVQSKCYRYHRRNCYCRCCVLEVIFGVGTLNLRRQKKVICTRQYSEWL